MALINDKRTEGTSHKRAGTPTIITTQSAHSLKPPASSSALSFPSATNGPRRARAETVSAYPSSMLRSPPPAPRQRSGSMTLPTTSISDAFGASIFASSWQPDESILGSNVYSDEDVDGEAREESVRGTLEHLGLDNSNNSTNSTTAKSSSPVTPTTPMSARIVPSISPPRPFRGRSYSVAASGVSAIPTTGFSSSPSPSLASPSAYGRKRATSIAYLESSDDMIWTPKSDMPVTPTRSEPTTPSSALPPNPPSRSLYLGNIDPSLVPADLLPIFKPHGPLESIRILTSQACAFVNYIRVEDAVKARDAVQGLKLGNCVVKIGFGKDTSEKVPGGVGAEGATKSLWIGGYVNGDVQTLENIFRKFGEIETVRVLVRIIFFFF